MLDKVKAAFVGAGIAAVGAFFVFLEGFDWTTALPAAFLPFLPPIFAYIKSEGLPKLQEYISSKTA